MAKLQYGGGRFTITIPKEVVEFKHWEKGKKFIFNFDQNDRLVLLESDS